MKEIIEGKVKEGEILLDVGVHRYIKNDDLFFPCVKNGKKYHIKSVLEWDMVKDRMQRVIDLYND